MCERRARMCKPKFLQCGCVPGVCARDLISGCQVFNQTVQWNCVLGRWGHWGSRRWAPRRGCPSTAGGAGHREGAVPQRQEEWGHGGRSADLHACGLPKLPPCSGSGIERRDINFQTHVNCWTLHCSCDKGWLFKSEHPTLKSVTLKVSSDQ